MRVPRSRFSRVLLAVAPAVSFALAISLQGSADDQVAGDFGPAVNNGPSLDRSMVELDATIQDQYAKERLLASLQAPVSDQDRFQTVAAAGTPSIAIYPSSSGSAFGPAVFDGPSLESNLVVLNEDLLLRGDTQFVTVAANVSDSGATVTEGEFDYVAAILGSRFKAEALRERERSSRTGFGTLVRDDSTLEKNIALLNDDMQKREFREVMLSGDLPPVVTDTSFAVAANAMAVGFD
jgi:hypothetical protein